MSRIARFDRLNEWFTGDWLNKLNRSLAESTGLPNAAYTEPEFLRWENECVIPRSWVLAGFSHQVPAAGDVVPVTVADKPLVLVHDEQDQIRVFHNVCRHRGARLIDSPCSGLKFLRCPNHHWSYGLDGRVRNRPHFFGPEKHDTHAQGEGPEGLKEVRSGVWNNLVFVNLDGGAQALEDYLQPLTERIADYDLTRLKPAGVLEWELNCNWKLVNENFIEPYHVFAVHPGLLKFGPMSGRRASEFEEHCFYNDYQFPQPEQGRGLGLPYFPGLTGRLERQAIWFHLFPSLTLEIFPDQMAVWELVPLSPQRTLERIHIFLIGDAAFSDEYAQAREQVFATWNELNNEDIAIIERMQQGRISPGFEGGVLSPFWDGAIQHYARLMTDALKQTRE